MICGGNYIPTIWVNDMNTIEKYRIEAGTEDAKPVIVLTGTFKEFEDFCMQTNRTTKTAIAIRQGYQLDFYPDLDIVLYGSFDTNAAYNSQEYRTRTAQDAYKKVNEVLG